MRLLTVLSVSAFVLPLPARSATIHVPADQPTIQGGINVAIPGDTVLVAPGTYTGADNKELDLKGKAVVLRSENGAASSRLSESGWKGRW